MTLINNIPKTLNSIELLRVDCFHLAVTHPFAFLDVGLLYHKSKKRQLYSHPRNNFEYIRYYRLNKSPKDEY